MSTTEGTGGPELPATGFRAIRGGGAAARFAAAEAALLRGLVSQVAELVGEGLPPDEDGPAAPGPAAAGSTRAPGSTAAPGQTAAPAPGGADAGDAFEKMLGLSDSSELPDDPVLARLLPDAYPDDLAAAGEFRRYTERGLRSAKVAAAMTVLATLPEDGGRVRLSEEEAQVWLRSLNDIRLALGVRLEVTEDREAMLERAERGGPHAAGLWIYDWLTLLQETLVEALW